MYLKLQTLFNRFIFNGSYFKYSTQGSRSATKTFAEKRVNAELSEWGFLIGSDSFEIASNKRKTIMIQWLMIPLKYYCLPLILSYFERS